MKLLTKLLPLLFLFPLMAACNISPTNSPPDYIVMLTNLYPDTESRCQGELLDSWTILTAGHCKVFERAVTQNGQEAFVTLLRDWPDIDVGLYRTDRPLFATNFAEFATTNPKQMGFVYGVCPFYFNNNPKPAFYMEDVERGLIKPQLHYEYWKAVNQQVCGGDSGGVVLQNNKIVGLNSAVDADIPFIKIGTDFYIVPSHMILDRLKQIDYHMGE